MSLCVRCLGTGYHGHRLWEEGQGIHEIAQQDSPQLEFEASMWTFLGHTDGSELERAWVGAGAQAPPG